MIQFGDLQADLPAFQNTGALVVDNVIPLKKGYRIGWEKNFKMQFFHSFTLYFNKATVFHYFSVLIFNLVSIFNLSLYNIVI